MFPRAEQLRPWLQLPERQLELMASSGGRVVRRNAAVFSAATALAVCCLTYLTTMRPHSLSLQSLPSLESFQPSRLDPLLHFHPFRLSHPSHPSHPSRPSHPPPPTELHPTLVGPRLYTDLYPSQKCGAVDFLIAVQDARIKQDGKSLTVDYSQHSEQESMQLPPFEWSFELSKCPQPHTFTPEEACDLLSAYGGIYFVGDSFVRHIMTALLILVGGKLDGAVVPHTDGKIETCVGEMMFDDRKLCRERINSDTRSQLNQICGGSSNMFLAFATRLSDIDIKNIPLWLESLPRDQRIRSPIIVQGHGVHACYDLTPYPEYLQSLMGLSRRLFPSILNFWAGAHHPGVNQPAPFVELQGPAAAEKWNEKIQQLLHQVALGESMERGGPGFLPFFNVTDGASSYDGVHYSYQVNMEKAQILLNLLDILWGRISRSGGLIVLP